MRTIVPVLSEHVRVFFGSCGRSMTLGFVQPTTWVSQAISQSTPFQRLPKHLPNTATPALRFQDLTRLLAAWNTEEILLVWLAIPSTVLLACSSLCSEWRT